MPEKEVIAQVGLFAGTMIALTTFWWKLTGRFVKKDIFALHLKTLNDTLKRIETDSTAKWDAITEVAKVSTRTAGMMDVMMNNQKKRKGDGDDS